LYFIIKQKIKHRASFCCRFHEKSREWVMVTSTRWGDSWNLHKRRWFI